MRNLASPVHDNNNSATHTNQIGVDNGGGSNHGLMRVAHERAGYQVRVGSSGLSSPRLGGGHGASEKFEIGSTRQGVEARPRPHHQADVTPEELTKDVCLNNVETFGISSASF